MMTAQITHHVCTGCRQPVDGLDGRWACTTCGTSSPPSTPVRAQRVASQLADAGHLRPYWDGWQRWHPGPESKQTSPYEVRVRYAGGRIYEDDVLARYLLALTNLGYQAVIRDDPDGSHHIDVTREAGTDG